MSHVFIAVGEASGDDHASSLIETLKRESKEPIQFSGLGGDKMKAAGVQLLFPLANHGVTGVTEALSHLSAFYKAYRLAKQAFKSQPIDLLILIDNPGFNLRLAKLAKQYGIRVLYYISPQLWAWKAKRIKQIQKTVDTMAVIFPFEKQLYEQHGVNAHFVGHPLASLSQYQSPKPIPGLAGKTVIGLLPGSRTQEITKLLPNMLSACKELNKRHNNLLFVLAKAQTAPEHLIKQAMKASGLEVSIIEGQTRDVIKQSHAVVVASGTASLEAALLNTPMAIVYKTSRFTYILASQLVRIAHIGLPNVLAKKMIVPELIQDDFTVEHLTEVLEKLISDKAFYKKTKQALNSISKMLEINTTDCRLSALVLEQLTASKIKTNKLAQRQENLHLGA